MDIDQTISSTRTHRQRLLPGALVALVAVVGIDLASSGTMVPLASHGIVPAVARATSPSGAAILTRRTTLVWCTATLLLFLVFGRQLVTVHARHAPISAVSVSDPGRRALLQKRKLAISYRAGGLYGP